MNFILLAATAFFLSFIISVWKFFSDKTGEYKRKKFIPNILISALLATILLFNGNTPLDILYPLVISTVVIVLIVLRDRKNKK